VDSSLKPRAGGAAHPRFQLQKDVKKNPYDFSWQAKVFSLN
jgi:hypothetical protein